MMVVLDTNFLTLPSAFKIDIFQEIKKKIPRAELATVGQVVSELGRLGSKGKIGLEMIDRFGVRVYERSGGADDALLELAAENWGVLCTNDKELKTRALERKVRVMFMRKKRILEIAGGLDV